MAHFLDQLIQFVAAHPHLAYATVFLAALLEAVPVLGSFVPGSSVIIGLSAFVAAGELGLAGVLASAIAGAVIGDGSAFLLGHLYQRRILGMWPLKSYPGIVARSEAFFRERGAIAILFARFVPPVRAFVPLTAGALGMPPARFFPFNLAAIACWAPAHIVPGMLAGSAWHRAGALGGHVTLPLIVGLVALAALIWGIRRLRRRDTVQAGS
jgi:membrane protein DedA with SNARE-associated domain